MSAAFEFVLHLSQLGNDTILNRTFASAFPIFRHDVLVLLVCFALVFVYRAYVALRATTWNAYSWGLVLAFLVRRGMATRGIIPTLLFGCRRSGRCLTCSSKRPAM